MKLRKIMSAFTAFVLAVGALPVSVSAADTPTVNTVTVKEKITNESTIYYTDIYLVGNNVGIEVMATYLYSDDFIVTPSTIIDLREALGNWSTAGELLPDVAGDLMSDEEKEEGRHTGLALSTKDQHKMDAGWKDAVATAEKLFPEGVVANTTLNLRDDTTVEGSANYYDTWNGSSFFYFIDYEQEPLRKEQLGDNYFSADKKILSRIGSDTADVETYKNIDGVVTKLVNSIVTYDTQATTIIYSSIEVNTSPDANLTVNFYVGDELYNTQTVKSGEKIKMPADPLCSTPGETFLYWLNSPDPMMAALPDLDRPVYNDMNLYANFGKPWKPVTKYNFTLNTDDDSFKPEVTFVTFKNDEKELTSLGVDGEFSVPSAIGDGEYTMTVSADNFAERTYEVTVKDQELVEEPDVTLNLIGDVNGDKKLNAADLLRAKSHIKGVTKLEGYEYDCADVDDNGTINAADLLKMKSHIKGVSKLW